MAPRGPPLRPNRVDPAKSEDDVGLIIINIKIIGIIIISSIVISSTTMTLV